MSALVVITRLRLISETTTNADVAEVTRQAADMYEEALWNASVLRVRLDAAGELHVADDCHPECNVCNECEHEWPCPTWRALNGEVVE